MGICKLWLRIMKKSAAVWSFIILDPGSTISSGEGIVRSEDDLHRWLKLSRKHPLDIFAAFPDADLGRVRDRGGWGSPLHEWGESSEQQRPPDPEDTWFSPTPWELRCRNLLDMIIHERARWRDVVIHTAYHCDTGSPDNLLCPHAICAAIRGDAGQGAVVMPRLENLGVYGVLRECYPERYPVLEGVLQATSLVRLTIEGGLGPVWMPQIREIMASDNVPLRDLWDILKCCAESLDTLRWRFGFRYRSQQSPGSVHLPRLKTLVLQDPTIAEIGLIVAPAVELLIVESPHTRFTFACVAEIQSVESVVSLDLSHANVESTQLRLLICGLPSLQDLRFKGRSHDLRETCFDELRETVLLQKGSKNPFRHLRVKHMELAWMDPGERKGWARLREVANWSGEGNSVLSRWGSSLVACFGSCNHLEWHSVFSYA